MKTPSLWPVATWLSTCFRPGTAPKPIDRQPMAPAGAGTTDLPQDLTHWLPPELWQKIMLQLAPADLVRTCLASPQALRWTQATAPPQQSVQPGDLLNHYAPVACLAQRTDAPPLWPALLQQARLHAGLHAAAHRPIVPVRVGGTKGQVHCLWYDERLQLLALGRSHHTRPEGRLEVWDLCLKPKQIQQIPYLGAMLSVDYTMAGDQLAVCNDLGRVGLCSLQARRGRIQWLEIGVGWATQANFDGAGKHLLVQQVQGRFELWQLKPALKLVAQYNFDLDRQQMASVTFLGHYDCLMIERRSARCASDPLHGRPTKYYAWAWSDQAEMAEISALQWCAYDQQFGMQQFSRSYHQQVNIALQIDANDASLRAVAECDCIEADQLPQVTLSAEPTANCWMSMGGTQAVACDRLGQVRIWQLMAM